MSSELRETYLKEQGARPVISRAEALEWSVGRVLAVSAGELIVQVHGENIGYFSGLEIQLWTHTERPPWGRLKSGEWPQLLNAGDLVAVRANQERELSDLLLLVPNLKADFPVANSIRLHKKWTDFLQGIRETLKEKGFQEVETPGLVACPGLEPHLLPFGTKWNQGGGVELYLPTSPEIHLKKMLARGYENIFEIKKVYRNDIASPKHRPEFTMLEWYLTYASLNELKDELIQLINTQVEKELVWTLKSVSQLFKEFCGFDLAADTPAGELQGLCDRLGLNYLESDSFDDLFQRIWMEKIEDNLGQWSGLVVSDFPPSQAALARINSEGWADRFEIYLGGVECANAYQELNDPAEQEARFEAFQKERNDGVPIDYEFLEHLKSGMPPSAGVAVGLERLFMAANDIEDINSLYEF